MSLSQQAALLVCLGLFLFSGSLCSLVSARIRLKREAERKNQRREEEDEEDEVLVKRKEALMTKLVMYCHESYITGFSYF